MNLQIVPNSQQLYPVHKQETREVHSLSTVLSRALHNEPHLAYLIPDEEMRRTVSSWFFEAAILASRFYGEIYTAGTADGVALWISPEHNWSIGQVLRTQMLEIPFDLEAGIYRRFLKLSASLAKAQKRLAPVPHWYLVALGVGRTDQQEEIGGALIEPVLSRADSTGMPCYLETFNEKRLGFYKSYGFRIAGAGKVPGGGPSFWAMTRAAKI